MIRYVTLSDARVYLDRNRMYARDYGLIDSALHRPRAVVFGAESYPGIHDKAAALFDGILRSHPLIDGNKRLAWALTMLFYRINDRRVRAEQEEAHVFVRQAASAHEPLSVLAHWFATHTGETYDADEEEVHWFDARLAIMAQTIAQEDAERAEALRTMGYQEPVAENDR